MEIALPARLFMKGEVNCLIAKEGKKK